MMVRRKSRGIRRRGRRGRRRPRSRRQLGGMVRGRQHPPSTTASPWLQLAMFTIFSAPSDQDGPACVTAADIINALKVELGLADVEKPDLRVLRVDAWTMPENASSANNTIVFAPCDWTQAGTCGTRLLNWFEAWGTAAQPAHIHYIWPVSISNIILPVDSTFPVYQFDMVKGTKLLNKVHLLWRPSKPDPRPNQAKLRSWRDIRRRRSPPPDTEWDVVEIGTALRPIADSVAGLTK